MLFNTFIGSIEMDLLRLVLGLKWESECLWVQQPTQQFVP